MRTVRNIFSAAASWVKSISFGITCLAVLGATRLGAQAPANDNFANAQVISGIWGTVTNDNTGATNEIGEPSHAGYLAAHSIWYQFTAPLDGEVTLDTYGSTATLTNVTVVRIPIPPFFQFVTNLVTKSLDTILAVYTGASLPALNQVAANDDLYASLRYNGQNIVQFNESADNSFILDQTDPSNQVFSASAGLFIYNQPFTGPSGLRFDATAGTTYYIALDSKASLGAPGSSTGVTALTWAYHSSGVFRFASENLNASQFGIRDTNGNQMLLYKCSETESRSFNLSYRGISLPAGSGLTYNTTFHTYYNYDVPGLLVTVTRVAGSSGRVSVDYTTMDVNTNLLINGDHLSNGDHLAVAGADYFPVSGRLTFDDFEMSKTILIPIVDDFLTPQLNRDFIIAITNVALDTLESAEVSPPRADPTYYQALVKILDVDIDPKGPTRNDIIFTNTVIITNSMPFVTNSITVTNVNYQLDFPTNAVYNFEKVHYRVPRDATNYWGATPITVYVRRDGTNQAASTVNWRINNYFLGNSAAGDNANIYFPLDPGSDYATPNPPNQAAVAGRNPDFDFSSYNGTLTFPGGNNRAAQPISFTIFDNGSNQFNEDFHIELYDLDVNGNPFQVGMVAETTVTILYDDLHPPAGSVDENHNSDFGIDMAPPVNTTPAQMAHPGTDGEVDAVVVQSDDKTILAGHFGAYDGQTANGIVRANTDGSLDSTFNAGDGIFSQGGDFISSVVLQPDGKIIVVGNFPSFAGVGRNGIARLNADGSLDAAFNPAPNTGADGTIWTVALQDDGKVLIGGEFTSFNGTPRARVARLNADGTVDSGFDPGANAPNNVINAIAIAPGGKVVIGGDFTQLGTFPINRIARLNASGARDILFNPGAGIDGSVYALAVQPNGSVIAGGEFLHFNTVYPLKRLVRMTSTGLIDTNFIPGIGPDGTVYHINLQSDGTLYIGGSFTAFNGTHRLGFARLYADGTVDTTFLDAAYNQFAGLPRKYFSDTPGTVFSSAIQSDGKVMIGGSFDQVGGGQFQIAVRPESMDTNNYAIESALFYIPEPKTRDGIRNRSNIARLIGGATPGPGNISLANSVYSANESQSSLYVNLLRSNGTLGPASASFSVLPGQAGQAQSGVDYFYNSPNPLYWLAWEFVGPSRMHSDGLFGTNTIMQDVYGRFWSYGNNGPSSVIVSVSQNPTNRGDLNASFQLANPPGADQFYLGGQNIPLGVALGRSSAPFKLIDDFRKSGVFGFALPSFSGGSNSVTASISRTNGTYGTVQMNFATSNGTAVAGIDYQATNGLISFLDGQTNRTFPVRILQSNYTSSVEKTINLSLFNLNGPAGGGAAFGLTNAIIRIVNPNFQGYLNFSSTNYAANLSAGVMAVTVTRTVGSKGTLSVQLVTSNGTAINGLHYVGLTNVLSWNDGDVSARAINIPLINDGSVGGTKQFYSRLLNPTLNGFSTPSLFASGAPVATLTITNNNSYGTFQFASPSYLVDENGGIATLTVIRTSGANQAVNVNFATADVFAFDGVNYRATNGTLAFAAGDLAKSFNVQIIDDGVIDPSPADFYFAVNLTASTPGGLLGFQTNTLVKIKDSLTFNQPPGSQDVTFDPNTGMNDDVLTLALQSDGDIVVGGSFTAANSVPRNHVARLSPDGTLDVSFLSGLAGANGTVNSLLVQSDNRIVIGGAFTFFNAVHRNFIARLTSDGSLDTSFNPGGGADNPVYAVAQDTFGTTRKIYLGGAFNFYNGQSRTFIARLNNDGTLDGSFVVPGVDGAVFAIATYPTNSIYAGKVLIGGGFTHINGTPAGRIARLNSDGTQDATFVPGTGASDTVRALVIQLDGRVLLGGAFTNVNGVALNHAARLNADGSVDSTFSSGLGVGADDTVSAMALQPDNRIILGGSFTHANGVTRNRITRLMPNGAVDPTINFGTGANNFVAALAVQTDGAIILGGGFTTYDNVPHAHLARIYGGSIVGSGTFEFTSGTYQTDEVSSNALITVRRNGGTSGPNADGSGAITVDFDTSDGTAVAGVNYGSVHTTLIFPAGEVIQTVNIPIFLDQVVTPDLTVNLALSNPSSPAGIGNQPTAILTIINNDSTIRLSSSAYSVNKNNPFGVATVDVLRQGSTNGTVTVEFLTTTNGTAIDGTDYLSVSNLVTFNPGVAVVHVQIPILNNPAPTGNRTVDILLTNATTVVSNLVNLLLVPPSEATLTIIDTVQSPGQLMFAATNLVVGEANSNVVVSVIRTNGSSGTISVTYNTLPGTAQPGVNYTTATGVLTFGDGETVKTFNLPLLENNLVQGPVTLALVLSNPQGGATIFGSTNLPVTILDNDAGLAFSSAAYVVNETNGSVTLSVLRLNNTSGTVQVSYATTNGSALAGTNFQTTAGTLTFNPGETNKSINVPILHDLRATSNLTFSVNLFNPTAGAQLTFPSSASVILLDAEAGVGFTNASFTVLKGATNAVLVVFCSNPNVEPISVNYNSADGTAIAGTDYVAVNGTLTFTNGAVTNYILVPIINNNLLEGDLTFTVTLSSPTPPGQLLPPSTATVTIKDINAGLSFSSPTYSILKNGVAATIGVIRSGFTNSTVSVNYATLDGTGTNGVDYTGVSGTLVFTNGQTSLTFSVPVTDSTTVKPDRTVLLQLSNPVGTNAVLVAPSAAILTIHDNSGSLIVPAGVALLTESGPVNGVIDPNETVSLLFALRNGGGTNTANLTATLLATNGVTSPSAAQNYGTLLVNGPSVSRPYSFIANGSNGSPLVATFLLTNGTGSAGSVSFTFTLGNNGASFTNGGAIIIPSQGAASPYPSTINVSGVGGSLTKATVTLNKMFHTSATDINALLVSPTGQKTLLMANAGGFTAMNGVTLTFDDAAASYLPPSTQISSGTNKPSAYTPVLVFPAPAPAAPYNTNLSSLNGSNPNGTWSLYVMDDSPSDSGIISNGWFLTLTAVNLVGSTADLAATMTAANSVIAGNNLTYTVTVTNYGPSTATGVTLTDTLPANVTLVSSNSTLGGISVAAGIVTWTPGTLPINAGAVLTLVVNPAVVGTITNSASVQGNQTDPNLANNSATATTTVDTIKADLVISVVDAPDPLWNGNNVTYTITVTNAGPATAPGVSVTNTLSPTVIFVSASPGGYVRSGNLVTFTNLGNLAVGAQTVASIVVKTTTGGTITNVTVAASQVTDPFKANNSATVKTVVDLLQLGVFKSGANLIISWPTNTPGYFLESSPNLNSPIIWTTVTSPAAVVSNGQYVITISVGSGNKYFRLHGP